MPRLLLVLLALAAGMSGPARAESNALARAEEQLRRAYETSDKHERFDLADRAIRLCEEARASDPRSPRPDLVLSKALYVTDPQHPERCRPGYCEKAVEVLLRARRLDNGGLEAREIASQLGIVYSRLGRFADALAEYDRALRLVHGARLGAPLIYDLDDNAVLYGNSAETLMALGRLDEAIARYQRAAELSQAPSASWELAQWGLGIALDRDGQEEGAVQAVDRALSADPGLTRLNDEEVFFEPPGDQHYYLGLGHAVAFSRWNAPLDLARAVQAFERYLAVKPALPHAARARAHLARLQAHKLGPAPPPPVAFHLPAGRTFEAMGKRLSRYHDDVRLCYARALVDEPELRGYVTLELRVFPSGHLIPVQVRGSQLSSAFEACLERAIGTWQLGSLDLGDRREFLDAMVTVRLGAGR
jgi:tetratricopeptide (TPR) repeat protein